MRTPPPPRAPRSSAGSSSGRCDEVQRLPRRRRRDRRGAGLTRRLEAERHGQASAGEAVRRAGVEQGSDAPRALRCPEGPRQQRLERGVAPLPRVELGHGRERRHAGVPGRRQAVHRVVDLVGVLCRYPGVDDLLRAPRALARP
jgi:hypothetical protein